MNIQIFDNMVVIVTKLKKCEKIVICSLNPRDIKITKNFWEALKTSFLTNLAQKDKGVTNNFLSKNEFLELPYTIELEFWINQNTYCGNGICLPLMYSVP